MCGGSAASGRRVNAGLVCEDGDGSIRQGCARNGQRAVKRVEKRRKRTVVGWEVKWTVERVWRRRWRCLDAEAMVELAGSGRVRTLESGRIEGRRKERWWLGGEMDCGAGLAVAVAVSGRRSDGGTGRERSCEDFGEWAHRGKAKERWWLGGEMDCGAGLAEAVAVSGRRSDGGTGRERSCEDFGEWTHRGKAKGAVVVGK